MMPSSKQVGIRIFLFLVFASLLIPHSAQAAKVNSGGQKNKNGAYDNKILSFGEVIEGAKSLLPDVSWQESTEKKGEEPEKDKPIIAHKIENSAPQQTPASDSAPYKVYRSSYIPEENSYFQAKRGSPEISSGYVKIEPQQISADKKDVSSASKAPPTAPVAGMSRQFFPLLPLDALPDTPSQLLPVFSSQNLVDDHSFITRVVVFIHDISRNANEGVTTMATLAGSDDATTLIVAPQFPIEADITRFAPYLPDRGQRVARWMAGKDNSWSIGANSVPLGSPRGISSFTAMDLMLLYFADKNHFPGVNQIILAGYGMGADFVQRYAAVGQAPDVLAQQKMPVRFLAANASSYLYLTSVRPGMNARNFAIPTAQCPEANNYPYGLGNLNSYARQAGGNAIRLRYPERRVMYLLSNKILSDPYLDRDCAALMQGKSRYERGRNYERYLKMSYGEAADQTHSFTVVPGAGDDPVSLFGSYCGLAMLFGDGKCSTSSLQKQNGLAQ